MKSALSIASTDPSGGAGISADLRAFAYTGVHGLSVVTTVTSQNTRSISKIHEVPLEIIESQLDSILSDIKVSACKTGMLYSPQIVKLIARKSQNFDFPLIVDPVLKATVGGDLTSSDFVKILKEHLIPHAHLITPNIPEAEVLLGKNIETVEDMKSACKSLLSLECENVLLKGGHLKEKMATDILYDGTEFHYYLSPHHSKNLHGTGCTHSALICGFLAQGSTLHDAAADAKMHISNLIQSGYSIGSGVGVVGISKAPQFSPSELSVIDELKPMLYELVDILPIEFVPEVGINFGYAIENARSLDDILALEGRLIRVGDHLGRCGGLKFGSSKHIARIILTAMKYDLEFRSAMNIKYTPEIVKMCSTLNFTVGSFERIDEPQESSTMEWGTDFAIKEIGTVPDIVYDTGGVGKEPMIRILGKNPKDVIDKLKMIADRFNSQNNER
jgi:hydroxymethylpyrimidine/phosphomethylpyrimidine kinase